MVIYVVTKDQQEMLDIVKRFGLKYIWNEAVGPAHLL